MRIQRDKQRFNQILKGKIKNNLKKYITNTDMFGKKGNDVVSIPVPRINLPRFTFDHRDTGGVGQGKGDIGDVLQPGSVQPGGGPNAGEEEGDDVVEAEVTIDELAQMLGDDLELPNIQPRGKERIASMKNIYKGISTSGPQSLRHFKRTYKEALKRSISSGIYDPKKPVIIPIGPDTRYRSVKQVPDPDTNAAIIYIMDVSASMGEQQKWQVRTTNFWIDTWIKKHYKGVKTRYIIHDWSAEEVDDYKFYRKRSSGGTLISSGLDMCERIIARDFDPEEWNIYVFQYSDGDNMHPEDDEYCMSTLNQRILPLVNLYCYGQCLAWGTDEGHFIDQLEQTLDTNEYDADSNLCTSRIYHKLGDTLVADEDDIYNTIRTFLSTGK